MVTALPALFAVPSRQDSQYSNSYIRRNQFHSWDEIGGSIARRRVICQRDVVNRNLVRPRALSAGSAVKLVTSLVTALNEVVPVVPVLAKTMAKKVIIVCRNHGGGVHGSPVPGVPVLTKTVARKVIASRTVRTHARLFAATMAEGSTAYQCLECLELKDWSRVKCSNCQSIGHAMLGSIERKEIFNLARQKFRSQHREAGHRNYQVYNSTPHAVLSDDPRVLEVTEKQDSSNLWLSGRLQQSKKNSNHSSCPRGPSTMPLHLRTWPRFQWMTTLVIPRRETQAVIGNDPNSSR
ncbi:uncharacterized protein K444DRAFT_722081 [Hyaloscypha bicolor E]|uniref:Uncharacterized protein n=1 Tax=Hyaloscypha bicolor E TaxID=1095630 RepID=A0A2J6TAW5_9HELO|nr:uncharacterized protein K444DRAFT_722081 [Hyaloscypha bicolor E]PMD60167.1 hypothetical protein K444DRAFT_722081 [Hyaloscypha bicolor E]